MQELCSDYLRGWRVLRDYAKQHPALNWTYVTPAYKFLPGDPVTGVYHVDTTGEFDSGEDGNPALGHNDYISYAD